MRHPFPISAALRHLPIRDTGCWQSALIVSMQYPHTIIMEIVGNLWCVSRKMIQILIFQPQIPVLQTANLSDVFYSYLEPTCFGLWM